MWEIVVVCPVLHFKSRAEKKDPPTFNSLFVNIISFLGKVGKDSLTVLEEEEVVVVVVVVSLSIFQLSFSPPSTASDNFFRRTPPPQLDRQTHAFFPRTKSKKAEKRDGFLTPSSFSF